MIKKAQTEIFGLLIVFILLLIGATFVVKFITSEEPTSYKKEFINTELGSNMINTFLGTTNDCDDNSTADLLRYCAQDEIIGCSGQDSCDYVASIAKSIFTDTLERWNVKYEFKIFISEDDPLIILGKSCLLDKKSNLFVVPTESENLIVKLDICG